MIRLDPYTSFRFRVEIGGITVARATEVTGLEVETEIESYREGGINDFVHQLPKGSKYRNITLKRGVTDFDELWQWRKEVVSGKFKRKEMAVILMDAAGNDKHRWNFTEVYPVKWTGPDFKADTSAVAFETVELTHHGFTKG